MQATRAKGDAGRGQALAGTREEAKTRLGKDMIDCYMPGHEQKHDRLRRS
jgi:hypothetical protein